MKSIKVDTRKINANVTRKMIQDMLNFKNFGYSGYYSYKLQNKSERSIIEKYININDEYSENDEIVYEINNILLRKIKLLKLSNNIDSNLLERVIRESIIVSMEEILSRELSNELSKQIDINIIKSLMKLK